MTRVRPLLQATITGRTALIVTPAGMTEQLSAGAGQDVRNVVISRAYREAVALGLAVEILTAGDRGEFHLVVDTHGALKKVEFTAEPEPPAERAPTLVPTTAAVRTTAQESRPGPLRKAPVDDEPRPFELDEEMDQTVMVRRALTVRLEGADVPPIVGAAIVGRRARNTDPGETVTIDDPTGTVSRQHARIETTAEEAWITDLGSVNGTLVLSGGRPVELTAGTAHVLSDGDRLQLGDLWLTVRVEGARR